VRRFLVLMLVAAWATLAIAACGDDDDDAEGASAASNADMTVVMKDTMQFEPETITLAPGEQITINLENDGSIKHNFSIDESDVDESLDPKKAADISFTAPSEAGEYKIYCDVPGHEQAGMVGTLIVEE
jgi:plastocyanin